MSSSSSCVSIVPPFSSDSTAPIRVLSLNAPPVNSMNFKLWNDLSLAIDECEANPSCRSIIICSGLEKEIFTAGNDIRELYAPMTSEAKFQKFWKTSNETLVKLYKTRLFTVAAIKGACPAGGCILSLVCDYRLMADAESSAIGLNEVALGIPVPKYWTEIFAAATGKTAAEQLLGSATMMKPAEALKNGIINEITSKSDLMTRANKVASDRLKFPDDGRVNTKLFIRSDIATRWVEYLPIETANTWKIIADKKTVAALGKVMERLAGAAGNQKKSKL